MSHAVAFQTKAKKVSPFPIGDSRDITKKKGFTDAARATFAATRAQERSPPADRPRRNHNMLAQTPGFIAHGPHALPRKNQTIQGASADGSGHF
ncbi:hypothetical protein BV911_08325 [Pseudoruegeria sp. SK021]|nr:hypothetical protein BV911_08325 [Pseudoruegeria sp. SK021]